MAPKLIRILRNGLRKIKEKVSGFFERHPTLTRILVFTLSFLPFVPSIIQTAKSSAIGSVLVKRRESIEQGQIDDDFWGDISTILNDRNIVEITKFIRMALERILEERKLKEIIGEAVAGLATRDDVELLRSELFLLKEYMGKNLEDLYTKYRAMVESSIDLIENYLSVHTEISTIPYIIPTAFMRYVEDPSTGIKLIERTTSIIEKYVKLAAPEKLEEYRTCIKNDISMLFQYLFDGDLTGALDVARTIENRAKDILGEKASLIMDVIYAAEGEIRKILGSIRNKKQILDAIDELRAQLKKHRAEPELINSLNASIIRVEGILEKFETTLRTVENIIETNLKNPPMISPLTYSRNQVNNAIILAKKPGDQEFSQELHVDRGKVQRKIMEHVQKETRKNILIVTGRVGVGKTWLLSYIAKYSLEKLNKITFLVPLGKIDDPEEYIRQLLYKINPKYVSLETQLEEISNKYNGTIIILDALDEHKQDKYRIIRLLSRMRGIPKTRVIMSTWEGTIRLSPAIQRELQDLESHGYLETIRIGGFTSSEIKQAQQKYGTEIPRSLIELTKEYPFLINIVRKLKQKGEQPEIHTPEIYDEILMRLNIDPQSVEVAETGKLFNIVATGQIDASTFIPYQDRNEKVETIFHTHEIPRRLLEAGIITKMGRKYRCKNPWITAYLIAKGILEGRREDIQKPQTEPQILSIPQYVEQKTNYRNKTIVAEIAKRIGEKTAQIEYIEASTQHNHYEAAGATAIIHGLLHLAPGLIQQAHQILQNTPPTKRLIPEGIIEEAYRNEQIDVLRVIGRQILEALKTRATWNKTIQQIQQITPAPTIPTTAPAITINQINIQIEEQTITLYRGETAIIGRIPKSQIQTLEDAYRLAALITRRDGNQQLVKLDITNPLITRLPPDKRGHVKIQLTQEGQIIVMDLGSTNRTAINGKIIPPNKETTTRPNTEIVLAPETTNAVKIKLRT